MEAFSASLGFTFVLAFLSLVSITASTTPTIVVSKDGSGNYCTVSEAVAAIPNNSATTYTVYIKAGVYHETVHVGMEKSSVVFLGEGIGRTVITFDKCNSSGYNTIESATVDIEAGNFVAKYISFVNSAGNHGGQAVALRSAGLNAAYYKCSFEGHQDTLYAILGRKFFQECDIFGTTDFIFGDGAIIFQNCNIYGRKPNVGTPIVVTAESRESPKNNTGIVLQNCTITTAPDFGPSKSSFRAFLGRPWGNYYSRTIVMESYLGDIIDPAGWLAIGSSSSLDRLSYAEYRNRGPGASTKDRVKLPGYTVMTEPRQAFPFTVENFINGSEWLPVIGIPFISGLALA